MSILCSKFTVEGVIDSRRFTVDMVKDEPTVSSADLAFTSTHCGPITSTFLAMLPQRFKDAPDLVIDSRVHSLEPGWLPQPGPGWHLDRLGSAPSDEEHAIFIVGDCSLTAFAVGECELKDLPRWGGPYQECYGDIENYLLQGQLQWAYAKSGELITFDHQTIHRTSPATKKDYRFFIRASRKSHRVIKNTQEHSLVFVPGNNGRWQRKVQ